MQMKKSIALFIVLVFITISSVLIGIIYQKSQKSLSLSDIYQRISQNSIVLKEFENILKNNTKDINSSEDLDALFITSPLFSSKNGDFVFSFSIQPLSDKINLNLLKDEKKKEYIEEYIFRLCSDYEVKDIDFFIALLEDTIDMDNEERAANSEIVLENRNFKNGSIESFSHFYKILDYYFKYLHDSNIYKIDWKSFIYFDEDLKSIIDCDRLSLENAKYLGFLKGKDSFSCEELQKNKKYQKLFKVLNIKNFTPKESYLIEANFYYKKDNFEEDFKFRYNIFTKKITKIGKTY